MKVLLKKEIYEFHKLCMEPTEKHWNVLLNKKKKKLWNAETLDVDSIQMGI